MSYKCRDCGNVFEYPALWEESRGEYWGLPAYETVSGCPECRGDYEELKPCKICNSECFEDELECDICYECIEKYQYDIDMCFKIGANDTDEVKLNCFLSYMFKKDEIEKILFEKLKERQKYEQIDCEEFIDFDRSWFAEMLLEEIEKEKK